MKKIVVCYDKNKYTFPYLQSSDCLVFNVYKKPNCNLLIKIIRKVLYFLGFKLNYIFYDDWYKYLNEDVEFIFFDEAKPYFRLAKILNKTKNKVYIYFWNPILDSKNVTSLSNKFVIYTYSKTDSIRYNIKFNETFLPLIDGELPIKYDCVFVGKNKNRLELINYIYSMLSKPFFWVVKDGDEQINFSYLKNKNEEMSYSDYIDCVKQSKSILEILPSGNAGLTLRTAEAILYQKKLITNNKSIVNDDIFSSGNVLVINNLTSKEEVIEFINKPINEYSSKLVKRFSVDEWLKRFI